MLQFSDGETFAVGAIKYIYAPATDNETTNRIKLPITFEIEKSVEVLAVLDTGAPYPILDPAFAKAIGFSSELALDRISMRIRGMNLEGSLIRLNITLEAEQGRNLTVDATTFVPDSEFAWGNFPCFIGLSGFLERIRFAIDPNTDTFYFGSL
jgi:hypothetical protein